jgi:hypothetical protein
MWPEKDGYLKYDKFHPTAPKIEGDIVLLVEIIDNLLDKKEILTLSNLHMKKQVELSKYVEDKNNYALTSGSTINTKTIIITNKETLNSIELSL